MFNFVLLYEIVATGSPSPNDKMLFVIEMQPKDNEKKEKVKQKY